MNIRHAVRDFETGETGVRERLQQVVERIGARRAERLQGQLVHLERLIHKTGRVDNAKLAQKVHKWLSDNVAEVDDPLKRATVAALVLHEVRRPPLPVCMLALYPGACLRLARFLDGPRAYDDGRFASDLALATGAAAPAGGLTVTIPSIEGGGLYRRWRHVAGATCRDLDQHGMVSALKWLKDFGPGRIAELHVDMRDLGDFHREGFLRCYHRLAALMQSRPDLVGVCGVSWLYDPQLAAISPNLAFVRETVSQTGARFVRVRTDPIQIAFAIAHSPNRRRLHLSGQYAPACHAMYWSRRALMDWSAQSQNSLS